MGSLVKGGWLELVAARVDDMQDGSSGANVPQFGHQLSVAQI
eukprot:CAMPEP_0182945330 /NCGR_PEP_ID=MMETSP0105_2-20130417/55378_1 /TAXON_ID=81532 ORGANISM="Acanthoeca-like sp., Strain 10tr" /NCGR_SAMPLE_ID=MMETSP0105_2 /ASSEMBLY_ACC=CAM_ASM_000205 /LENGTH=41 /DNA_ID= /DNA_START= /DNA_END= /DNA_ORIENTATION=